ncbi:MAG TPA: hypothetical protein VKB02_08395 [Pyrinomonadaceae bacterium]|nr:hypothetical protein [Pyrinomonadaceae bacterium]
MFVRFLLAVTGGVLIGGLGFPASVYSHARKISEEVNLVAFTALQTLSGGWRWPAPAARVDPGDDAERRALVFVHKTGGECATAD